MTNINVTREELALIEHIHETLHMFGALPLQREGDMQEFGIICQRLQDFIAARATYRRITTERRLPSNGGKS
ncbi:hypothetical protein LCGC14_1592710 [marine sediment metagenome]|uniref:Uncharacterized protein n=1 Tax=marine sediment metagenome TaxID=412755 RepID=A0A0F9IDG8_9ZZZZ